MIARWPKLVAVLLAVMFTGAAHACMCARMGQKGAAPMPADPHACCKQAAPEAPAVPASNEDPCKNCNAQHPLTITVPEKATVAPAPDFEVLALLPVDLPLVKALMEIPERSDADHVPIPPLLRDLVHTSCQLTV